MTQEDPTHIKRIEEVLCRPWSPRDSLDTAVNSSIFGRAKPVDRAKREKEIEEKLLRKKEKEMEEKEMEKSYTSIFSGATPVDTAKKEPGIEERLLRKQEEAQEPNPTTVLSIQFFVHTYTRKSKTTDSMLTFYI